MFEPVTVTVTSVWLPEDEVEEVEESVSVDSKDVDVEVSVSRGSRDVAS